MCLNPILIKNQGRMYKGKVNALPQFSDTQSQYIYVNCGVCSECVKKKQMYLIQRCQLESLDHYIFFATFTYKDDMLPFIDVNGFRHYYADISDFQNMIKRCRKRPEWIINKYLFVTEYGGKRHRPHFHALFFVPKSESHSVFDPLAIEKYLSDMFKDEWKRNVGSTRNPIYKPLCEFITRYTPSGVKSTFDFHYVQPDLTSDSSDVSFYVTKYVLKFDSWVDDKRKALYLNLDYPEYHAVWNLLRPRLQYSHFFGATDNAKLYVRHCIDKYSENSTYPVFRNPFTGQLFPMSPYLFNKFGTLKDKYKFYYKCSHPDSDSDSFHYLRDNSQTWKQDRDKLKHSTDKVVLRNNDVYEYF